MKQLLIINKCQERFRSYVINCFLYLQFLFSAVFFEQKDYKKCIEQCEKAISVGRIYKAEFKLIAKAFTRIGNAHLKLGVRHQSLLLFIFLIKLDSHSYTFMS